MSDLFIKICYCKFMKKLSIYIFFILLIFSNSIYADDIQDFQIEGISIGDSLLDHLSKEEIITEIAANKQVYNYLTDKFGEVYLFNGNFEIYENLSFFVKQNDKNYKTYSIRGMITYDDNIEKCYTKQNEIAKEISLIFKNAERIEDDFKFPWDPTGKSHIFHKKFILNSGDVIYVSCSEYERNLKIENGWTDGLSVSIKAGEVVSWLQNHIN